LRRALQRGPAFLVEDAAMPCACIFAEDRLDRLYLGRLAVAPDARRRGLARALLQEAEGYARSVGAPLMELNVRIALSDNIRLFQRAGFAITEQRSHPGFTIPTYYVMEKRLD
jgi:GNAT superfamily N-acetyltransferase